MHRTKSKSLGKLFRFSKSLPEAQAQLRERHIAPNAFSPQLGAAEFLWRRKHAGRRSDSSRKQPKRRTGCRLCDFPRETEARRIFLPGNLPYTTLNLVCFFARVFLRPLRPADDPRRVIRRVLR